MWEYWTLSSTRLRKLLVSRLLVRACRDTAANHTGDTPMIRHFKVGPLPYRLLNSLPRTCHLAGPQRSRATSQRFSAHAVGVCARACSGRARLFDQKRNIFHCAPATSKFPTPFSGSRFPLPLPAASLPFSNQFLSPSPPQNGVSCLLFPRIHHHHHHHPLQVPSSYLSPNTFPPSHLHCCLSIRRLFFPFATNLPTLPCFYIRAVSLSLAREQHTHLAFTLRPAICHHRPRPRIAHGNRPSPCLATAPLST